EEAGKRIEAERAIAPFTSMADVITRCGLRDDEAQTLAHLGAFAAFGLSRRAALWQAAAVPRGALFSRKTGNRKSETGNGKPEPGNRKPETRDQKPGTGKRGSDSPLPDMTLLERTLADYRGSGLTAGPHIVTHLRAALIRAGVLRAGDLAGTRNGQWV